MSLPTIVVDASASPAWPDLVPHDGAFGLAMRGLLARPAAAAIPDRVLLELYAYEIVERLRDLGTRGAAGAWSVPFWPPAALAAADVEAHAARELRSMWPRPVRIVRLAAAPEAVALRQRSVFGVCCFDAAAYARAVLDDDADVPGQRVASAWLRRGSQVLLEQRAATAAVYAGLWDTPGGKLQPGETGLQALRRECAEELGIRVESAGLAALVEEPDPTSGQPFVHHVFTVPGWSGAVRAAEGQQIAWLEHSELATRASVNPQLAFVVPR